MNNIQNIKIHNIKYKCTLESKWFHTLLTLRSVMVVGEEGEGVGVVWHPQTWLPKLCLQRKIGKCVNIVRSICVNKLCFNTFTLKSCSLNIHFSNSLMYWSSNFLTFVSSCVISSRRAELSGSSTALSSAASFSSLIYTEKETTPCASIFPSRIFLQAQDYERF